jgi:uncharacterized protein
MHDCAEAAASDTRRWVERAVIGLNLCPFAKAVHIKGQIYYAVSTALNPDEVLDQVGIELDALATSDSTERETTLLIVPGCLKDFLEFTNLLTRAERLLRKRGHEGVIQLASFHPAYQFAQTEADDISNFTNRAPYPTIHLLREASIDRAVHAFPQAQEIYEANIHTLQALGHEGWAALGVGRSK